MLKKESHGRIIGSVLNKDSQLKRMEREKRF